MEHPSLSDQRGPSAITAFEADDDDGPHVQATGVEIDANNRDPANEMLTLQTAGNDGFVGNNNDRSYLTMPTTHSMPDLRNVVVGNRDQSMAHSTRDVSSILRAHVGGSMAQSASSDALMAALGGLERKQQLMEMEMRKREVERECEMMRRMAKLQIEADVDRARHAMQEDARRINGGLRASLLHTVQRARRGGGSALGIEDEDTMDEGYDYQQEIVGGWTTSHFASEDDFTEFASGPSVLSPKSAQGAHGIRLIRAWPPDAVTTQGPPSDEVASYRHEQQLNFQFKAQNITDIVFAFIHCVLTRSRRSPKKPQGRQYHLRGGATKRNQPT